VWPPCPVGSSLVVAISYARFDVALTLTRQMLPTGQVSTQHYGLFAVTIYGNYTQIIY